LVRRRWRVGAANNEGARIDLLEDLARKSGNRFQMNRRGYLFEIGRAHV